jgi:5-methylcytosine-specific restriction enzyme subunit McrC
VTTPPEVLRLVEWTATDVECSVEAVAVLQTVFRADVSPVGGAVPGRTWRVRPSSVVGIARTDHVLVVVRPRIPVANVLLIAGASATPWRDDDAPVAARDDIHLALARLFVRTVERTLSEGVLRGYREQHDDLLTVRGRIDIAEQIRRRPGHNLPLAVVYQEHDEDVTENRILKAAAGVLAQLGLGDATVERGLHRILMTLRAARPDVATSGTDVLWTRLNARYRPAVELARLVLGSSGVDVDAGGTPARSLTLDMPRAFEYFLARELGLRLETRGGTTRAQDTRWSLDEAQRVPLRPDIVWDVDGRPAAVVDAKYQTVGPRDAHGDNVYQLLAYCTALGLRAGHLVYANADGDHPRAMRVARGGPVIHAHALDLSRPVHDVLSQVETLAATIARTAHHEMGQVHPPARHRAAGQRVSAP